MLRNDAVHSDHFEMTLSIPVTGADCGTLHTHSLTAAAAAIEHLDSGSTADCGSYPSDMVVTINVDVSADPSPLIFAGATARLREKRVRGVLQF
jgi:hypothetical protein